MDKCHKIKKRTVYGLVGRLGFMLTSLQIEQRQRFNNVKKYFEILIKFRMPTMLEDYGNLLMSIEEHLGMLATL